MEHIGRLPFGLQDFASHTKNILDEYNSWNNLTQFSKYKTKCFEGVWVEPSFHHFAKIDGNSEKYVDLLERILVSSIEHELLVIGFECLVRAVDNKKLIINREFVLTNDVREKYELHYLKDSMIVVDCPITPSENMLRVKMHEEKYVNSEKLFDSFMRKNVLVDVESCIHLIGEVPNQQFNFHHSKEDEKLIFLEVLMPLIAITRIAFGVQIKMR